MSGQVWVTNSLGGFMYSNQLSDELRHTVQPLVKFRQFADVKEALGKHAGQTYTWDVYKNISVKGGTLVETNTMRESNFTIVQGTGTVVEYGNSVPYSGLLDDLSLHPVKQVVNKVLKHDCKKAQDVAAHSQFKTCLLRYVGTLSTAMVITTDGTATATNTASFTKEHAKLVVDDMKERNIPPYVNDDYYAIAWPSTLRGLKNDLEQLQQYSDIGYQLIMNGEIGRYENMRYVEQTHIPKGGAADSTTWNASTDTADAWDNALSDWIFFMGDDTVSEGVSVPEEMRGKIPTDFGRSKGIAWYSINGYAIVHSDIDNTRIAMWDSAS